MRKYIVCVLGFVAFRTFAANWYVTGFALETEGDGTSWSSPMSLPSAISAAAAGDVILCKAGTYIVTSSISIAKALTVKGGLSGDDDETLDAASPVTVFDAQDSSSVGHMFNVTTATSLTVTNLFENISFNRAYYRAVKKTGKAAIGFRNCRFYGNGSTYSGNNTNAGAVLMTGTADSEAFFSDCLFDGNAMTSRGIYSPKGAAVNAATWKRIVFDDCSFYTNGVALNIPIAQIQQLHTSVAIFSGAPVTMRGCEFRGNKIPAVNPTWSPYAHGNIVQLENSSGSAFTNCLFVGNQLPGLTANPSKCSAQIGVYSGENIDIDSSTFAFNMASVQSSGKVMASAVGVTVLAGSVKIRNSVFYGNIWGVSASASSVGLDVHAADEAAIDIDYSYVTGKDTTVTGSGVIRGDNLLDESTGNPYFIMDAATLKSMVVYHGGSASQVGFYRYEFGDQYLNDLMSIDVHEGCGAGDGEFSIAVDKGDPNSAYSNEPEPNGSRINLGCYGNTDEAATSPEIAVPEVQSVQVSFTDEAMPDVTVSVGGEGANAELLLQIFSQSGVLLDSIRYYGVKAGDTYVFQGRVICNPDEKISVSVEISSGSTTTSQESEHVVTGTIPPYHGHGGGSDVIHVRKGARGFRNGANWTDACESIESALAVAASDSTRTKMWIAGDYEFTEGVSSRTKALAGSLDILGGFSGMEDSLSDREEGVFTTLSGGTQHDLVSILVKEACRLSIERVRFQHAYQYALQVTGSGDVTLENCHFVSNAMSSAGAYSIFQGSDSIGHQGKAILFNALRARLFVTNCLFAYNCQTNALQNNGRAAAAVYVKAAEKAEFYDSSFFANGAVLNTISAENEYLFKQSFRGAAIHSDYPLSLVRCSIKGNSAILGMLDQYNIYNTGSIVYLGANAGGSSVSNCLFAGNTAVMSPNGVVWSGDKTGHPNDSRYAGVITVNFSDATGHLDVHSSTFACNFIHTFESSAGITLYKGSADIKNCIFGGNIYHDPGVSASRATDVFVSANSSLDLSYSHFANDMQTSVYVAEGGVYNEGEGVASGDPLFASSLSSITNLLSVSTIRGIPGSYYNYTPSAEAYETIENFNAHLAGGRGYIDEKTGLHVSAFISKGTSPALDAGDPGSDYSNEPDMPVGYHGKRVNIGAYGNTPWATMSTYPGAVLRLR